MRNVILHQWEVSPFCGKVRKVLRWKGLSYQTVDYNGMRSMRVAKLSGAGKLPVLEYDGTFVQDSSDIAAFIDQRHPDPPLYPTDAAARGAVMLLEDWSDESLYWYEVYLRVNYPEALRSAIDLLCSGRPAWERFAFAPVFRRMLLTQLRGQGLGRQDRNDVEKHLFAHLASLDAILAGRNWLVGPTRTVADAAVSAQVDEMLRTSVLASRIREHANLLAWLRRCAE